MRNRVRTVHCRAFHPMIYRRRLKQHMDVVLGRVPAFILAAAVLTWFTMWWFVLPLQTRVQDLAADDRLPDEDEPSGKDG